MAATKLILFLILFTLPYIYCEDNYTSLKRVISALEKLLKFYKGNYRDLNLDGLFGLRAAEGHIHLILSEHKNGSHAWFTPNILSQLQSLANTSSAVSAEALEFVKQDDEEYYNNLKYLIEHPWDIAHKHRKLDAELRWTPKIYKLSKSVKFDESVSDTCMSNIAGNDKNIKKCTITKNCLDVMTAKGLTEYGITHQLLWTMLAEKAGCLQELGSLLGSAKETSVSKMQTEFCTNNFYEMAAVVHIYMQGTITGDYQDLFLEQQFVCPSLGFYEFLKKEYLDQILSWQFESGCFAIMKDKDQKAPKEKFMENLKAMAEKSPQIPDLKFDNQQNLHGNPNVNNLQQKQSMFVNNLQQSFTNFPTKQPNVYQGIINNRNTIPHINNVNNLKNNILNSHLYQALKPGYGANQADGRQVNQPVVNQPFQNQLNQGVQSHLKPLNGNQHDQNQPGGNQLVQNQLNQHNGNDQNLNQHFQNQNNHQNRNQPVYNQITKSINRHNPFLPNQNFNQMRRMNQPILNQVRIGRKLLVDKEMKDGCLAHTTAVAAGALVMYLRFLIDPGPMDFHGSHHILQETSRSLLSPIRDENPAGGESRKVKQEGLIPVNKDELGSEINLNPDQGVDDPNVNDIVEEDEDEEDEDDEYNDVNENEDPDYNEDNEEIKDEDIYPDANPNDNSKHKVVHFGKDVGKHKNYFEGDLNEKNQKANEDGDYTYYEEDNKIKNIPPNIDLDIKPLDNNDNDIKIDNHDIVHNSNNNEINSVESIQGNFVGTSLEHPSNAEPSGLRTSFVFFSVCCFVILFFMFRFIKKRRIHIRYHPRGLLRH
ncbi:hypothetical protein LOTGIDRAFT_169202 [Lottia gigantea]|uniref:Uncharacterized protein n=1 Tax=Lottia gigantea TaxID=225164 RepID=V3YZB4_LOTGI|nr:hypothetical protein LOTGIDRAFT_169202 [Lottia gigantea]ESO83508.1 hypothetical protein LOTGIDRAFT_169202 [Lottia gigantea]